MSTNKCETGCQHYTGGEIRHIKNCQHYPESFSEMYDNLKESHLNIVKSLPTNEEIHAKINELFDSHGKDNGRYVSQEVAIWIRAKVKVNLM